MGFMYIIRLLFIYIVYKRPETSEVCSHRALIHKCVFFPLFLLVATSSHSHFDAGKATSGLWPCTLNTYNSGIKKQHGSRRITSSLPTSYL